MAVRIALALASMMSVTVHAAEPVTLYAAGSLRGALTEVPVHLKQARDKRWWRNMDHPVR